MSNDSRRFSRSERGILGGLSICICILWLGCYPPEQKRTGNRLMMGSFGSVIVYASDARKGDDAIDQALTRMETVDKLMSHYKPDSEISQINRLAGYQALQVSVDTFRVIQAAINYSQQTDGAFDITIAPLVQSWGFFKHEQRIPSLEEIQRERSLVDFHRIQLHEADRSVFLKETGMQLDLGGIAKGYAVDLAAEALRKGSIMDALVNLSDSTFFALGHPPGKAFWQIAIQHPRKKDAILGTISLTNQALATSSDSEQFFIHEGVRYSHILDPRTGYPVSNGVVSTTVIAPTGIEADALSTAVFVLGAVEGMKLIQARDGVEGVIVRETPTGELIIEVSPGLKERFEPQQ